jgi:type IV pilus assembly protein PilO
MAGSSKDKTTAFLFDLDGTLVDSVYQHVLVHAEWPIALELDGTYHNLAIFFDRVGKFTRIVNISGVNVKGKTRPEPNSTITATCVATTFVLLEKPTAAAKGKPAKKST